MWCPRNEKKWLTFQSCGTWLNSTAGMGMQMRWKSISNETPSKWMKSINLLSFHLCWNRSQFKRFICRRASIVPDRSAINSNERIFECDEHCIVIHYWFDLIWFTSLIEFPVRLRRFVFAICVQTANYYNISDGSETIDTKWMRQRTIKWMLFVEKCTKGITFFITVFMIHLIAGPHKRWNIYLGQQSLHGISRLRGDQTGVFHLDVNWKSESNKTVSIRFSTLSSHHHSVEWMAKWKMVFNMKAKWQCVRARMDKMDNWIRITILNVFAKRRVVIVISTIRLLHNE